MARETKPDATSEEVARSLSAESDRALRHTWLRGFQDRDRPSVEALETLASTVLDGARRDYRWDYDTPQELSAVARDLDSLADYLAWQETAETESELEERGLALRGLARGWESRLRALAREIRGAVGEDGRKPSPSPSPGGLPARRVGLARL